MEMSSEDLLQGKTFPGDAVELFFKGTTEIVGADNVALMVLTDLEEKRQISVLISKASEAELLIRKGAPEKCADHLPEVLRTVFPALSQEHFSLYIYGVEDGRYKVVLMETTCQTTTPIRISDAVLLARVAGLPIYIERQLFHCQSVPFDAESRKMALPLNTLSLEMLHKTLKKAVDNEDYEQAALVKQELEQRNKNAR